MVDCSVWTGRLLLILRASGVHSSGACPAAGPQVRNRRAAVANTFDAVQVDANASFTRRTLIVTRAPIFRSATRIVAHVTRSSLVPASPMRRTAHMRTYGKRSIFDKSDWA